MNLFLNSFQTPVLSATVLATLSLGSIGAHSVWAKTTPQTHRTQIHVVLLGQPCLLQGSSDLDAATLKIIHSLGPAQLYPNLSIDDPETSKNEAKKSFEKIKSTANLVKLEILGSYREKLMKRLEAQIAFLDAVEVAKKTGQAGSLQKIGTLYIRKDPALYQKILKKMNAPSKNPRVFRDLLDQLFDAYNDAIQPDPEDDFHKATQNKIEYMCSFEENSDEGAQDE